RNNAKGEKGCVCECVVESCPTTTLTVDVWHLHAVVAMTPHNWKTRLHNMLASTPYNTGIDTRMQRNTATCSCLSPVSVTSLEGTNLLQSTQHMSPPKHARVF
ncbi:unnamed protein product, partial [Ectocarpus sp. 13 AM-2016]